MAKKEEENIMAFIMEELTVKEMESVMEKTKTVIIPVGLPEQHGFHLPLSTDILNAVIPPRIAGDRLNAVVAPSVNYCFSGGELMGTINVSPNAFGIYMSEICSEFIKNYCISKGKEGIQWYIDKLEEEKAVKNEKENTKVKLTAFEIRKAFIEKYFPTLIVKKKKNTREDLINELKALL